VDKNIFVQTPSTLNMAENYKVFKNIHTFNNFLDLSKRLYL